MGWKLTSQSTSKQFSLDVDSNKKSMDSTWDPFRCYLASMSLCLFRPKSPWKGLLPVVLAHLVLSTPPIVISFRNFVSLLSTMIQRNTWSFSVLKFSSHAWPFVSFWCNTPVHMCQSFASIPAKEKNWINTCQGIKVRETFGAKVFMSCAYNPSMKSSFKIPTLAYTHLATPHQFTAAKWGRCLAGVFPEMLVWWFRVGPPPAAIWHLDAY